MHYMCVYFLDDSDIMSNSATKVNDYFSYFTENITS